VVRICLSFQPNALPSRGIIYARVYQLLSKVIICNGFQVFKCSDMRVIANFTEVFRHILQRPLNLGHLFSPKVCFFI